MTRKWSWCSEHKNDTHRHMHDKKGYVGESEDVIVVQKKVPNSASQWLLYLCHVCIQHFASTHQMLNAKCSSVIDLSACFVSSVVYLVCEQFVCWGQEPGSLRALVPLVEISLLASGGGWWGQSRTLWRWQSFVFWKFLLGPRAATTNRSGWRVGSGTGSLLYQWAGLVWVCCLVDSIPWCQWWSNLGLLARVPPRWTRRKTVWSAGLGWSVAESPARGVSPVILQPPLPVPPGACLCLAHCRSRWWTGVQRGRESGSSEMNSSDASAFCPREAGCRAGPGDKVGSSILACSRRAPPQSWTSLQLSAICRGLLIWTEPVRKGRKRDL